MEQDDIHHIYRAVEANDNQMDVEMQIIHREFLQSRNVRNTDTESSFSRIRNVDDLTNMGFNMTHISNTTIW